MVKPLYLLDTNIISEPLRPRPNPKLLAMLEEHAERLATASVVWHELWFGVERLPASRKRSTIEQFLFEYVAPAISILPYDESAARWHATMRAELQAQGRTPPFRDGQIAAIARVNSLTVVTANTSDFEHIPEIEIVDWID